MSNDERRTFGGFPKGETRKVMLPERFFSELLPLIDDLAELKLTVYCFWALHQREGTYRYLRQRDLLADAVLLAGIGGEAALMGALQAATARGTLLAVSVPTPLGDEMVYFMNTERGRRAVEALARGDWQPGDADRPVGLIVDQPNVFALYEQNIGPLTPLIAETLRDAEKTYPHEWVAEAIQIAVEGNKRSWRYVEAILKRWALEGKTAKRPAEEPAENPYLQDEYFRRRQAFQNNKDPREP